MRVAAMTSGHTAPASRFRIRQHLPNLRKAGLDVQEYCPAINQGARLPGSLGRVRARYIPPLVVAQMALNLALRVPGVVGSYQADVTWLERNFVPGLDEMVFLLRHPLIVDIDDAIWLYNPLGKRQIARLVGRADMVFAGNAFLADWCAQFCSNIRVIPTAVDVGRFAPRLKPKDPGSPFVIGWTGTSGNFRFLKAIEGALAEFLRDHPSARLMIVADRSPTELSVPLDQLLFRPWDPTTEHLLLHEFDVGIMPLDDSDLSRGKCSFKMLQYMAVGIPVIASPFGMNKDVLSLGGFGIAAASSDEWQDAMAMFFHDSAKRDAAGHIARDVVIDRFSLNKVSEMILDSISSFC